jgi:branched-chain amino acid aminotransferase
VVAEPRHALCRASQDLFVRAVLDTVAANKDWVPPLDKGAMYIRPLLIGSGPILGLGPAPESTLLVYVSPVGAYFKGGQLTPINLLVSEHFHRAAAGGAGGTKCIGNYAQVLVTQLDAKAQVCVVCCVLCVVCVVM